MIKQVYSSDLEVLIKLFIPKRFELHIFDPYGKLEFDKDFNFCEGASIPKVLVNLAPEVVSYKNLSLDDFDYVFDFGSSKLSTDFKCKTFHYINNPNKTMRWLFPKNLKQPSFLNFFNSNSSKAKLIKSVIELGFKTPLRQLIKSGSFKLYHKQAIKVERTIATVSHDNYSIFTGTVGPNRKAVIELNKGGESTHFVKIILNKASLPLLTNELRSLHTLNHQEFNHLVVPTTTTSVDKAVGIFSNIKPENTEQQTTLTTSHLRGIKELHEASYSTELAQWCSFYEKTTVNINRLKGAKRFSSSNYIYQSLNQLWEGINKTQFIPLATSHCDFTPWNTYVSEGKLHAYDWELSQKRMPMLFDIFHYVFQSGILIKRQNFKTIKEELDRVMEQTLVQEIVEKYNIDVALHYKLYLAIQVSYYMNLYERQEVLHEQAHWLVAVWKEALVNSVVIPANSTGRQFFMRELMDELAQKPHAVLKFSEESLDQVKISSDLDIAIGKEALASTLSFIQQHPTVQKVKLYQKSFMTTAELFFNDNSYLSLDFIYQFKRKSIQLLDATVLLKNTQQNQHGINVPQASDDLTYICLFYWLNNSPVPAKYQLFFQSQTEALEQQLLEKYKIETNEGENPFQCTIEKKQKVLAYLSQQKVNKGWNKLKNQLNYIKDSWVDLKMRRGFTVTFSGVDGAGKSTTIETIAKKIALQYRRKVVVLRHRPSVLPILSVYKYGKKGAEQRAINSLPRKGNNTSVISSSLRFAYYFTDYLFGQFYVFGKHILQGDIVLYDRYYYDFINDAKRSNIILPKGIVKMLFGLILKPRVNVFLYASPEVILNRKQELDMKAIVSLTADYRRLFSDYNQRFKHATYLQIENIDLDKTVNTIMKEISAAA